MKVKDTKAVIISNIQKHPFLEDYKLFTSKGEFRKIDTEKGIELSILVSVFGEYDGCVVDVSACIAYTDFKKFTKKVIGEHLYFGGQTVELIIKEFSGIPFPKRYLGVRVYNEDELNSYLASVNNCLDNFITLYFDKYVQIEHILPRYLVESVEQIKAGSGPSFCKISLLFVYFYKKKWIPKLIPIYEDYLLAYAPTIQKANYEKVRDYVLANL